MKRSRFENRANETGKFEDTLKSVKFSNKRE